MDATQTTFIVSNRSECGKSLIGDYIAKLTGGKSANISDPLIESFARAMDYRADSVRARKFALRGLLLDYGCEVARLAGEDIWVRQCKLRGANVINGVRRFTELFTAIYAGRDRVIWVKGNRGKEDPTATTLDMKKVRGLAHGYVIDFHVITNNLDTSKQDLHAQMKAILKG